MAPTFPVLALTPRPPSQTRNVGWRFSNQPGHEFLWIWCKMAHNICLVKRNPALAVSTIPSHGAENTNLKNKISSLSLAAASKDSPQRFPSALQAELHAIFLHRARSLSRTCWPRTLSFPGGRPLYPSTISVRSCSGRRSFATWPAGSKM